MVNKIDDTLEAKQRSGWLTRNVWGIALTSFLSDTGHEIATAILPLFFAALGIPAAILGAVEGVADGLSSMAKLLAGWIGDRVTKRKPIVVGGYALTGLSVGAFAAAVGWPLVMAARTLSWIGRGARGPLRDSILAESVPAEARGRAFGFERTGDTLGAIIGPLGALGLIALFAPLTDHTTAYRWIFLVAVVPGLLSAVSFAFLVREKRREAQPQLRFWGALGSLPSSFRRYLIGVGLFGAGDFAHTMLTLRAVELLTPQWGAVAAGTTAVALYVLHNIIYAGMSYPIGALGDRLNKRKLLASGYLLAAVMGVGLMLPFHLIWYLALIFVLGGLYIAVEDTLERVIAAELLPQQVRSTGFGTLAAINGVGDFISSLTVGLLWTAFAPAAAFGYAAVLSLAGALLIWRLR